MQEAPWKNRRRDKVRESMSRIGPIHGRVVESGFGVGDHREPSGAPPSRRANEVLRDGAWACGVDSRVWLATGNRLGRDQAR